MKSSPKLRPNVWDVLLAGIVLALAVLAGALVWTGGSSGDLTAVVSVDGAEADRVALSSLAEPEERIYEANGYTLHVRFTDSAVQVTASNCPTQDCVHTGAVTRSGQSIVCLPARLIVELEGGAAGDGGVDVVIG